MPAPWSVCTDSTLWLRAALCGLAIAAVLAACGDDPTPTSASATSPATPTAASLPLQALPSTLEEYRRRAEEDPTGRESLFAKAVETLSEDIRINPTNVDAYVKRGAAFTAKYVYTRRLDRDDAILEQAIADFTKAIDLDPTYAAAYIGRGEAYKRWERTDSAIQDFDKAVQLLSEAIRLDSDDAEKYLVRAKVYLFKRDSDKAIQAGIPHIGSLQAHRAAQTR